MRPSRKKLKKLSLREKVFRLLLLIVLLISASGFYAWREVGKIIDAASGQLPSGYSVSYKDHFIDTFGRLTLTEPKLYHSTYGLLASGDRLFFKPEDWRDFFSLYKNILLETYNEHGKFTIPKLTIHFEDLSRTLRNHDNPMFSEILALGCGDKPGFQFSDLTTNSIRSVSGSFSLDYKYSALAENIRVNSFIRLNNFADFEYKFSLNNASASSLRPPYLVNGQWALFNAEFLKVRDQYCAQLNGHGVSDFKEQHNTAVAEFMTQQGVNLDQNMVTRYAEFVRDPQSVSMLFQPTVGVPLNQLGEITYSNIVDILGMTLSLNAQAVEPLIESINLRQVKRLQNPPKKADPNEKRMVVINRPSLRQLRNLVQKKVRLLTVNNNLYRGRFIGVTNRAGRFEIRTKGGYATLSFRPQQIASIEYEAQ